MFSTKTQQMFTVLFTEVRTCTEVKTFLEKTLVEDMKVPVHIRQVQYYVFLWQIGFVQTI